MACMHVSVALDATEVMYESFDRQTVYSTRGFVSGWSSLITMKVSCNINVTFFPFDKQYCPVRFGQWIYDHRVYRLGELTNFMKKFLKYS